MRHKFTDSRGVPCATCGVLGFCETDHFAQACSDQLPSSAHLFKAQGLSSIMITTSKCLNNSKTSVRCRQHKEHRGLCCDSSHSEVSRLGRCRPIAHESVSSIRSSANADADTVLQGRNAGPDGLIWRGVPNQNAKLVCCFWILCPSGGCSVDQLPLNAFCCTLYRLWQCP